MAIRRCFYLSKRVGTGLTREDRFRSSLLPYITNNIKVAEDRGFTDLNNYFHPIRIAYAVTEEAKMIAADVDPDNVPLSPRFATDAALQSWLNGTSTFGVNRFRRIGLDIQGLATRRAVFRRILQLHSMIQRSAGISKRALMVFRKDMEANPLLTRVERDEVFTHLKVNIVVSMRARQAMEVLRTSRKWPKLSFPGVVI